MDVIGWTAPGAVVSSSVSINDVTVTEGNAATASADTIYGEGGNDTLDGAGGVDVLRGGIGNDTYVANSSFEGTADVIQATVNFALRDDIENLNLLGTAVQAIGNGVANLIVGNATDNLIDGGAGIDGLIGGLGGDTDIVDSNFDQIVENANEGIDIVYSSVSYALGDNLELLYLTGTAVQGFGNSVVNTMSGNAFANALDGKGGADVITGGGGNDVFILRAGEAHGDTIMDFNAGDTIQFFDYGGGAVLTQLNATVWSVTYHAGAAQDLSTLANAAALAGGDYVFL